MPTAQENAENWQQLVNKGKDAGRSKNVDASAEYFLSAYHQSKEFPETDPRRGQSAYFLAFTRYVQKKNLEAVKLFNEYLQYPASGAEDLQKQAQVHSLLGSIYFGYEQMHDAEIHIQKSLELESQCLGASWENQQFLASILMMQKKFEQAISPLESLFEHLKNNPLEAQKIAVMLAYAHKQLGDFKGEMFWQKKNLGLREQLNPTPITDISLSEQSNELPEGWGLDQLGHFLEASRRNELSTFVHKPDSYKELSALNDRFIENRKSLVLALTHIVRAKYTSKFSDIELKPEDWLEVYFYLRCHASFTAAVRLGLSAQGPETYMVLRGCIENALYAWHVSSDLTLKRIWLDRHKDEDSNKAVKKNFAIGDMKRKLLEANSHLGKAVNTIYDETIDRGAHPNVMAFLDNAGQSNSEGTLLLSVTTLNPGQLDELLAATATVGNLVFEIYKLIYPDLID